MSGVIHQPLLQSPVLPLMQRSRHSQMQKWLPIDQHPHGLSLLRQAAGLPAQPAGSHADAGGLCDRQQRRGFLGARGPAALRHWPLRCAAGASVLVLCPSSTLPGRVSSSCGLHRQIWAALGYVASLTISTLQTLEDAQLAADGGSSSGDDEPLLRSADEVQCQLHSAHVLASNGGSPAHCQQSCRDCVAVSSVSVCRSVSFANIVFWACRWKHFHWMSASCCLPSPATPRLQRTPGRLRRRRQPRVQPRGATPRLR